VGKEKNMLPQDPIILLSYINTQLRDHYSTLDALFEGLDLGALEKENLIAKLKDAGFEYDEGVNQFK
jgi:hypothetical protein